MLALPSLPHQEHRDRRGRLGASDAEAGDLPHNEIPSWAMTCGSAMTGGCAPHHGAIVRVTIGRGERVPPYAIVGGNPAGVMKLRFSPPIEETLLSIAWWDCPIDE
jgi:hypothetical protein